MAQVDRALVSGHANRGPHRPWHDVRPETERLDHTDDTVDFALRGAGVHYDKHGEGALLSWTNALRSTLRRGFEPSARCDNVARTQLVTAGSKFKSHICPGRTKHFRQLFRNRRGRNRIQFA